MARPQIDKDDRLVPFTARVHPKDKAEFNRRCKEAGLSPGVVFRQAFIERQPVIQAVAKKTPVEKELIFLVKKTSINLNQIAHALNAAHLAGNISDELYQRAEADLDMILRHLKATL